VKSERDEVDYADNLTLMAVDHPVGTRIALNDLVRGKQPSRYYTYSENLLPVKKAIFQDKNSYSGGKPIPPTDITKLIAKADNQEAWGTYGDDNQFTLDLGQLDVHQPVKLVMQGWTEFQSRGEMEANSKKVRKGVKRAPTFYEVLQPDGTWKRWPMEHFNGFTKTVVLDLTGKFPRDTTKFMVRLRGMLRPRIDFIGVDVTPEQKTVERYPKLLSADLHYRGVSVQQYNTFLYDKLVKDVILHQGNFTRYGDVGPLLESIDDKLVVMDSGDELSLEYQELPSPAPGMTRSFILKPLVYYKEFELAKVEPIPFRNMDMYQLPKSLGPYPEELKEYVREWNTREHQAGKRVPTLFEQFREVFSRWLEKLEALADGLIKEKQIAATKLPTFEYQTTYPLWVGETKPENHYSLNTNYVLLQLDTTVNTTTYNINSPGTAMWTGNSEPTPSSPGTDASANKSKLAADDTLRWITDNYPALNTPAEDGLLNYQMIKFVVDSQFDKYYSLKVFWKGYGEKSKGYDTTLNLWNFQTGQWDALDSRIIGTETPVSLEKYVDLPNYCLKCHGGTLPAGLSLGTNTHNVALSYPGDIHGGAAGQGWINATGGGEFTAIQTSAGTVYAPYARNSAPLPCTDCHDTHGTQNTYHLRENLNVTTAVYAPTPDYADNARTTTFCGSCHAGTVGQYHQACLTCHRRIPQADHYGFYNYTPQDDDFGRACLSCHKHGWSMPEHGQCHCALSTAAKAF
ncbi:MAG TPA: cytochrome c3 family protein, partial [Bacillota bacterium]|nr:cytochrome c3 family protein [Bacillota bacterium]